MDYTLYFDTGSSAVREWTKVNEIVRAIKQHNPREVVIEGHTDTQGSAEFNEKLSMARTEAVKRALASKGIKTTIIAADYEGENDQAIPTGDNVANQANRRVTVQLLK
jgi:outer membrane protein OmpA-like peptidoglycan-associated protein